MSNDRIGWGAVGPAFREHIRWTFQRAKDLNERLRQLQGEENTIARVRVWQELRDLNMLPPESTFYTIAFELRQISTKRNAARFDAEVRPRLETLYREYGLDDWDAIESWNPDPEPEELTQINKLIEEIETAETVAVLREFGEHEMADLELSDPDEFQRRYRTGLDLVHGPDFIENFMQEIREKYGEQDEGATLDER